MDVAVIGGSLTGLTFALACARRGIPTRVMERGYRQHQGGGALGISRSLLLRVLGVDLRAQCEIEPFPVVTDYREAVSWQSIHGWLRNMALQQPEIALIDGCSISEVIQTAISAAAIATEGGQINAQVIVGADGYQSVVRRAINPERPDASYAGYLLWRGLIREMDLPSGTSWPQNNDGVALVTKTGYRLVAYPVAGLDGSLQPDERLISFAWYDRGRTSLLSELHCLSPTGNVLSSLVSDNIPESVREELRDLALRIWPEPWSTAIVHALEHRRVFATPVTEYFPERLHRGRLAIIGDAAHVVSPVTGEGFAAGILDAEALADCLHGVLGQTEDSVFNALERYGKHRLAAAQQLVTKSLDWSRAYLREPGNPEANFGDARQTPQPADFRRRRNLKNKT